VPDKVVQFVFGNHKHWTGMVWEWGEDTLVNSTWALKRVIDETGLKAGLNFDGRGIEQLATIAPECIEWIKSAIADGRIELWGGTYTQPYGSLIGSESNIRQRVAGIRAFERILGVRPRMFAEEEFDLFSQLPQILVQLGYEGALLFPQHTWHTPTIPQERDALIRWEGIDGSAIPAVPYSHRCLMRGIPTVMETLSLQQTDGEDSPLVVTWLEMLDKPNWMWRTEFVIPYLNEMQRAPRIKIEPTLLSEHIGSDHKDELRAVRYRPEDVFHGVSAGKNGDALPRLWHRAEAAILRAENLASWCSYLGQPYPQYDSYPEWQIEEAWRNLMMSQGHDAYECEGFTNRVGRRYAQMAIMLAKDVCDRCESALRRTGETIEEQSLPKLPAVFDESGELAFQSPFLFKLGMPTGWRPAGKTAISETRDGVIATTPIESRFGTGTLKWHVGPAYRLQLNFFLKEELPPGILGSIRLPLRLGRKAAAYFVGTPFCTERVEPHGRWLHRYPTGHWLTSEQAEEWIPSPICFTEFVCVEPEGAGRDAILIAASGTSLALALEDGLDLVVFGSDPWDQENWSRQATVDLAIAFPNLERDMGRLGEVARMAALGPNGSLVGMGPVMSASEGIRVTAVRKVGEELEVRLFEAAVSSGTAKLEFRWDVEAVRRVTPLGEPTDGDAVAGNRSVEIPVRAHEIATLRVAFRGKRTEHLPIDEFRSIWVGTPANAADNQS
jgi:hypothetical protein